MQFKKGTKKGHMDFKKRITSDLDVCHGQAVFKGTRVLVSVVLDSLADGESIEDILTNFPQLTEEDIRAALRYASHLCKEETYAF